MKDNDLDNRPAPRYYVMAEVVFDRRETEEQVTEGRWRKRTTLRKVVTWVPDMLAMSELWRFAATRFVRMELVFIEDLAQEAPELWRMLDASSSNPFNDWHVFETVGKVVDTLPVRPDLLGVIDVPSRVLLFGGRGLTIGSLR